MRLSIKIGHEKNHFGTERYSKRPLAMTPGPVSPQKVTVDGVLSDRFGIDFGVPQGRCLGPLLFVIYSSKLFNIVSRHLPNVHAYADDTQLYLAFKPGNYANETAAVSSIQFCIRDLQNWMLMDKLKLNPEKNRISYSWN